MGSITVGNSLKDSDVTFAQRQRDLEEQSAWETAKRKDADKSAFSCFAQQNLDRTEVMLKIADSPLAIKIYFLIVQKMNTKNALVTSYQFFMDYFGVSKSTIRRAMGVLERENILQIKRKGGMSVYLLNPEIVWKGKGSGLRYCEFEANVLFTEKEWNVDESE